MSEMVDNTIEKNSDSTNDDDDGNDNSVASHEGTHIENNQMKIKKMMQSKNSNTIWCQLNMVQRIIGILLNFPFFSSVNGAGLSTLTCAFFLPRFLCENILYPVFRLTLGTLYPAYASYKAVRNKDVKEYVSAAD